MSNTSQNLDEKQDDVMQTVTDRPVEDLSKAALKAEWSEAYEQLLGAIPDERRDELWDRRRELWTEMRDRTSEKAPKCPDCGARRWKQEFGNPKHCADCGKALTLEDEELIEAIDDYWESVTAVPSTTDSE